jgi:hypothetical protein
MRKTLGTILALKAALTLVAITALPVMAADYQDVSASVTVNAFISVTLTDNGAAGLDFSSLNPGAVKQPEAAMPTNPSVTLEAAAENNADTDITIWGTDFTGTGDPPDTIDIGTGKQSAALQVNVFQVADALVFYSFPEGGQRYLFGHLA